MDSVRRDPQAVEQIVDELNVFLRGWAAYFRYGNSALVLRPDQKLCPDPSRAVEPPACATFPAVATPGTKPGSNSCWPTLADMTAGSASRQAQDCTNGTSCRGNGGVGPIGGDGYRNGLPGCRVQTRYRLRNRCSGRGTWLDALPDTQRCVGDSHGVEEFCELPAEWSLIDLAEGAIGFDDQRSYL